MLPVTRFKKGIQQLASRGKLPDLVSRILRKRQKGIFHRCAVVQDHAGRKPLGPDAIGNREKLLFQRGGVTVGKQSVHRSRRLKDDLPRNGGGKPRKGGKQPFFGFCRGRCRREQFRKPLARNRKRVLFFLGRRQFVGHTGQDLTAGRGGKIHRVEDRKDLIVPVGKNQVAILAHDLAIEPSDRCKPHFIVRVKLQKRHALKAHLPHAREFCPLQMLPQEHTEHGRRRGVLLLHFRKPDARVVCSRVDEQALSPIGQAELEQNLVARRHIDLFHPRARRRRADLGKRASQHSRVKSHWFCPLSLIFYNKLYHDLAKKARVCYNNGRFFFCHLFETERKTME